MAFQGAEAILALIVITTLLDAVSSTTLIMCGCDGATPDACLVCNLSRIVLCGCENSDLMRSQYCLENTLEIMPCRGTDPPECNSSLLTPCKLNRPKERAFCNDISTEYMTGRCNIKQRDDNSPTDTTQGQNHALTAVLCVVVLLLLATVVIVLILYWRFKLKVRQERSYHINNSGENTLTLNHGKEPVYYEIADPPLSSNIPSPPKSSRPHIPTERGMPYNQQSNGCTSPTCNSNGTAQYKMEEDIKAMFNSEEQHQYKQLDTNTIAVVAAHYEMEGEIGAPTTVNMDQQYKQLDTNTLDIATHYEMEGGEARTPATTERDTALPYEEPLQAISKTRMENGLSDTKTSDKNITSDRAGARDRDSFANSSPSDYSKLSTEFDYPKQNAILADTDYSKLTAAHHVQACSNNNHPTTHPQAATPVTTTKNSSEGEYCKLNNGTNKGAAYSILERPTSNKENPPQKTSNSSEGGDSSKLNRETDTDYATLEPPKSV